MWNSTCEKIFIQCIKKFENDNIRYFILRNYQSLPEKNISKDVDIIIEPGKLKKAKKILLDAYKDNGVLNCQEDVFGKVHCMRGISVENKIGIHIDLIEGYISKGYEIFSFEEMYGHVIRYKGFYVLDEYLEGIMIFIYKQFGYKKPKFKQEYIDIIRKLTESHKIQFLEQLTKLTNKQYAEEVIQKIENNDFDGILEKSELLTKLLRKYALNKKPLKTRWEQIKFICQKIDRVILRYKKYLRVFAVLAPDGTGKTTFLEALIDELNYYYVNDKEDGRFHIYHFRPTVLPNLGEVGEKAGIMEQDKNWTDPHRSKPANPLSSFIRISYYTLDYIIGWQKCVRNDVQYDRYSVFDRYSYDFIVDPLRTKLGLPKWIRKFFVKITPQPKIVFVLNADPEVIYTRKQELTKEEITRQLGVYQELANSHKRFYTISAEQTPKEMAEEAVKIIVERYVKKID